MNFYGGEKLKVCFYMSYLYLNELTGDVSLSDFDETWAKYSSDISRPRG